MVKREIHYATKKLQKYREDRNWSQAKLADFLSVNTGLKISRNNIQSWESQANGMKSDTVLEISNLLRIPVNELVETRTNGD